MCMYFGSEVILANLLRYYPNSDKGVDYAEIEKYCDAIKKDIANNKSSNAQFISFKINDEELEKSLLLYPEVFNKFMNKFYKGKKFNSYNFKSRVKPEMNAIMKRVAKAL